MAPEKGSLFLTTTATPSSATPEPHPVHAFNQAVIEEFRANRGRVGGPFEGGRLLLITTTGARSGRPHTNPVGYLPDGDRVLIIASAGGGPHHPAWYHNLVAHPVLTVEDGTFTYEARAEILTGEERDLLFARAAEADQGWAEYQRGTTRAIPVVALTQIGAGPPAGGDPAALLLGVHDAFRRELSTVREEFAASGPTLMAQLKVNCLTVCDNLHAHHTMEDRGLFTAMGRQHPQLAPQLDRLRAEHETVATLLAELRATLGRTDATPAGLLPDVDRLIAELEAHLTYEEEILLPLLEQAA
ncbi:Cation-binding protein OS=Streptomyces gougerotii OX=53448 GN=GCM10010227_24490 PE=3 SV=1 [Streptomyces diastaticus subsp. diastaticus]